MALNKFTLSYPNSKLCLNFDVLANKVKEKQYAR